MAFSDMDAAAEISKMSQQLVAMGGQLTTALIQIAEMRGEMSALRRDMDRMHVEREQGREQSLKLDLNSWSGVVFVLGVVVVVVAILVMIYGGGNFGG